MKACSILFGNTKTIWHCGSISSLLIVNPTAAALAALNPLFTSVLEQLRKTEEPEPCEIKKGLFSNHTALPKILRASQSLGSKRSMFMSGALFGVIIITSVAVAEER